MENVATTTKRYPTRGALVLGVVPALGVAGVVAMVGGLMAGLDAAAAARVAGLAMGVVGVSAAAGVGIASAFGPAPAFRLALLAMAGSIVRMFSLIGLGIGVQLGLDPSPVAFWGGLLLGFVAFSIGEIRALAPARGTPPMAGR